MALDILCGDTSIQPIQHMIKIVLSVCFWMIEHNEGWHAAEFAWNLQAIKKFPSSHVTDAMKSLIFVVGKSMVS